MHDKKTLEEFIYKLDNENTFNGKFSMWSAPVKGFSYNTSLPGKYITALMKESWFTGNLSDIMCILGDWESTAEGIVFTDNAIYLFSPKNSEKKFKVNYKDIVALNYNKDVPKLTIITSKKKYTIDTTLWNVENIYAFLQFVSEQEGAKEPETSGAIEVSVMTNNQKNMASECESQKEFKQHCTMDDEANLKEYEKELNVMCGDELIDISQVSLAYLGIVGERELEELEEKYHGDYDELVDSRNSIFWTLNLYRNKNTYSKERTLEEKIEIILNKYWYEFGRILPQPKSDDLRRDNWEFADRKLATFLVGRIDENGDAPVKWEYKKNYGKNEYSGRYHFEQGESLLSLSDDIMPAVKKLSKTVVSKKDSDLKISDLLKIAVDVTMETTMGRSLFCNNGTDYDGDTYATPEEMPKELAELHSEYEDIYGKIQKKKKDNEARLKKRKEFLKKYSDKSILTIKMGDETRKYLEGYCEFDIFSKKTEIDEKLKLYREKTRDQIRAEKEKRRVEKEKLSAAIIAEFNEKNLLSTSRLSNDEKIKAYSEIRDFCFQYMPMLMDRDFEIASVHESYPEYVSKASCLSFKANWSRISRSYSGLNKGKNGEEKVYEVLRLFDDRIRILRDFVWGCEHDFVVITPYGISTIEVKNLRGNYVLTETGLLKCLSNDDVTPKDIAFQSKKHLETLRKNLGGCVAFSDSIPLQEIICSAEANFTIKDNYHYLPVCYYNTVDKVLFSKATKEVLNKREMDKIEQFLREHQQEAFKFDVFMPHGEIDSREKFINDFAEVASGYLIANIKGE